MTDGRTLKLPIRQVHGPKSSWLELKGLVLILHEGGWTGKASTFIPIEWVTVNRRKKRPVNGLALVLTPALLGIAITLALLLLLSISPDHPGLDRLLAPIFISGLVLWVAGSLALYTAFTGLKPSVLLTIDSDPDPWHIEFWHGPEGNNELEGFEHTHEILPEQADRCAP